MPQAGYTRELRRRLREDGEATIFLDDLDTHRGVLDTDEEYRQRRLSRARQRLYWAAFYEHVRVSTQDRGDRVIGVVTGPVAVHVRGQLAEDA